MGKIKVGIIFGGESTEHEVSRRSAVHVINAIDKDKYDFALIEIGKDGRFSLYNYCNTDVLCKEILRINNDLKKTMIPLSEKMFSDNEIDVVFSVIHGTGGEDGVLQGFLELCGIPYVGSGVISSAAGFDKAVSKILFASKGIPQADYICINSEDCDWTKILSEAGERLGYPVFVKPANGGSSVGIFKVKGKDKLQEAVEKAFRYDRKVIIEAYVEGREFECAVIGGYADIKSLGVGEIVPCNEFYDYNAKYIDEDSEGIIPAPISGELVSEINELAVKAFRAIDCYGLARVDFFITEDNQVILNEINTMPGFTSISMYPKLWAYGNRTDTELISRLIDLAFDRNENYRFLKDYKEDVKDVQ